MRKDKDAFNFDREDFHNVLGMAKEGTISLFKLLKLVFHELNIRVRDVVRKVGESL